jgi:hypothetical protein
LTLGLTEFSKSATVEIEIFREQSVVMLYYLLGKRMFFVEGNSSSSSFNKTFLFGLINKK